MNDYWDDALDEITKETEKMSPDEIYVAVKNIRNPEFAELMKELNEFHTTKGEIMNKTLTEQITGFTPEEQDAFWKANCAESQKRKLEAVRNAKREDLMKRFKGGVNAAVQ